MLLYHFFEFIAKNNDRKDEVYKKYPKVEDWIDSEEDLENAEYPDNLDIFGTTNFLKYYDTVYFSQDFAEYVYKELLIDNGNRKDKFMEMIGHVYLLRQLLEHGLLKYGKVTLNNDKKIIVKKFNFEKSLQSLFVFLPGRFSNEINQKVKSDCLYKKFHERLEKIRKNAEDIKRKHIENIALKIDENTKKEYQNIKYKQKCIESYALLSFIREYQFIGKYNLAKCKGIIKKIYLEPDKKKIDKISFDERVRIFEFILEINAVFWRYFVVYENGILDTLEKKKEENKPIIKKIKNSPSHSLSNNISHSRLFSKENTSYATDFCNNIKIILDFFDTFYREHILRNPNEIKNHFLKALKAQINSKDWMYLVIDKQRREDYAENKKIVRVGVPMPEGGIRTTKKDIKTAVKAKVEKLRENLNNREDDVKVGKWKWLNFLRQVLKKEFEAAKKVNQRSSKKTNKNLNLRKK
jgi:hypothetical protein